MSRDLTMAYMKDIAARINDPEIYGGASLMVGAGFSKNAESIGSRKMPPDWRQLAAAMYDELYPMPKEKDRMKTWEEHKIIKTSGLNTLHLAEEYIAFFDRNKMNTLIENNIADEMFKPGELHKRLIKLNWKDIFTTNYDTLLERARDEIFPQKDYRIVLSQDNLPGSSRGKARIIKLHGSIPGVRPYIISEEDFRSYPMKSAAFVNTVQQALIETTLCMVGFSGDDPNFLRWHGWLHDNLGENCPQIYLIGLFGDMNESEKDVFRKRKIAVVDLAELLDGKEKDNYAKAYEEFLNVIELEYREDDSFSDRAPYFKRDILSWNWKQDEEEEYVTKILEFSNNILEQYREIVLLPQTERNLHRGYFSVQFDVLLTKCKQVDTNYIRTLSNLIAIQRMCFIPLYTNQADKLIKICDKLGEGEIQVAAEWKMQIYLYILEMYRIDWEEEKYQEIAALCEEILGELPDSSKNMYWIETAKYAAGIFDVDKVKTQLKKIGKADLKTNIAKAGLYVQIGENNTAEKILEECLITLSKLRLNTSSNASYKSYLNLCHDTLNKWWNREDDYSDYEYQNEQYLTRAIILDLENELRDEIIKAAAKDDTRENVFEVNISRSEIHTIGDNRLRRLSFEFILMLDMLCLPMFTDQDILIPTAMYNIMDTSSNTYWKISFMVRANSKDVVERFFSRPNIAKTDINVIKKLYDNIWDRVNKTKYISSDYQYTFFNHINALNILSRIVVFLDDEKIVELTKYFAHIQFEENDYNLVDIRNQISRISTRFNGKIGERLLKEIFMYADSRLYLASYFTSLDMAINNADRYYMNAISLTGKSSHFERDNGIAQLLCLWRNCKDVKYQNQIRDVIWDSKSEMFPSTNIFYEIIWEKLPYPAEVNFSKLYKEYIYDGLVNQISDNDLFRYVNLFYLTSPMGDGQYSLIDIDHGFLIDILNAIESDLKNEKNNNSGASFFGEKAEARKLRYINELLVVIYAVRTESSDETDNLIDSILELLKKKKLNCIALDAVKKAMSGEYDQALNDLKPAVWSNDEKIISEVSVGYQAILYIAKKRNEELSRIKDAVIEVLETLQYSDIKFVKSMWNLLRQLIIRAFSEDTADQKKLANVFEKCMRSYFYKAAQGNKYYFEALYNCNSTLKSYYDEVISKNINIHSLLENVIEYVKNLNMPELSSIWE